MPSHRLTRARPLLAALWLTACSGDVAPSPPEAPPASTSPQLGAVAPPTPPPSVAPPSVAVPSPSVAAPVSAAPMPSLAPGPAPAPEEVALHPFLGVPRLAYFMHLVEGDDTGVVPFFDHPDIRVRDRLDALAERDAHRMSARDSSRGSCTVELATEHVLAWSCSAGFARIVVVDGAHVVPRPEVELRDAATRDEVLGHVCPVCATAGACPDEPLRTSEAAGAGRHLAEALAVHVEGCGEVEIPWALLAGRLAPESPLAHALGAVFASATPRALETPVTPLVEERAVSRVQLLRQSDDARGLLELWRTLPSEGRSAVRLARPAHWGTPPFSLRYGLVVPEPASPALIATLATALGASAAITEAQSDTLAELEEREVALSDTTLPAHANALPFALVGARVVVVRGRMSDGFFEESSGLPAARAWTYAVSSETLGGWIESARLGAPSACPTPDAQAFEPVDVWRRSAARVLLRSHEGASPDRVLYYTPAPPNMIHDTRWSLRALDGCTPGAVVASGGDTGSSLQVLLRPADEASTAWLIAESASLPAGRHWRIVSVASGQPVWEGDAGIDAVQMPLAGGAGEAWRPLAVRSGEGVATWHWDGTTLVPD